MRGAKKEEKWSHSQTSFPLGREGGGGGGGGGGSWNWNEASDKWPLHKDTTVNSH